MHQTDYTSKTAIASTRTISSVSKHFLDVQGGDHSSLKVVGIEKVQKAKRDLDWSKRVLLREASWILKLNTRLPPGLNYRTDLMYLY